MRGHRYYVLLYYVLRVNIPGTLLYVIVFLGGKRCSQ